MNVIHTPSSEVIGSTVVEEFEVFQLGLGKRCSVLSKRNFIKKGILEGKDQKLFGGTKATKIERREFGNIASLLVP